MPSNHDHRLELITAASQTRGLRPWAIVVAPRRGAQKAPIGVVSLRSNIERLNPVAISFMDHFEPNVD